MAVTIGRVLLVIAVVPFAPTKPNTDTGPASELDLIAFGLAFFAAGHVVP